MKQNQKQALCVEMPLTEYEEALHLQHGVVAAKKNGGLDRDVVFMVEHPEVFTLGKNGGAENLRVSEAFLAQAGIRVVQADRGGNITFHGPGQLVVYPVLDLDALGLGVRDYVGRLELAMVRTVGEWGIEAWGHPENRGLWAASGKLGSIGIRVSGGICFHGLALNVNLSLESFTWINPCGFDNIRVTSMEKQLAHAVTMGKVMETLKKHLAVTLGIKLTDVSLSTFREGEL